MCGWSARAGRARAPLLSAFCLLAVFSLVTWQAAADGGLRRDDERLGRAMQGRLPWGVAEFFADLGSAAVAVPVLVLALGYAALQSPGRGVRRHRVLPPEVPGGAPPRPACPGGPRGSGRRLRPLLAAALAMAAVPALVAPLKALVARPGPPAAGWCDCYPSGHAATAAVAYGAAVLLLGPWLRRGARRLTAAGVLVVNGCVGAGLVVRGYHWPLDVVGGWLLSGALLVLPAAARAAPGARHRVSRPGPAPGTRGRSGPTAG